MCGITFRFSMKEVTSLPSGSQRLREVLNFLIEEKIVHSQTHFGDLVGVSKGNMSKYLNGQKEPKEDLLSRVIQSVQPRVPTISGDWLLTGEGSMLIESTPRPKVESNVTPVRAGELQWVEVPLVPYKACASVLSGFGDPLWQEDKQTMQVLVDQRLRGDYVIYEVYGDSMNDGSAQSFLEGDFLLCRLHPKSDWQYGIKKRSATYCVIATQADGIVLKQVTHHDKAEGTITCHSLNPDYSDYDLKLSEVQALFYVERLAQREL